MGLSNSSPRYTYVATTRYSKEERASLEIGDTLYPYDNRVEVLVPDIKGVVVVKTSIHPELLKRLFSSYYLSAVEYVTYVLNCVGCCGDCIDDVVEQVRRWVGSGLCYNKVRIPRFGELGRVFVEAVQAELTKYARKECSSSLSVEVFGRTVCYGPVIHQRPRIINL